jgi:hypothetical protein
MLKSKFTPKKTLPNIPIKLDFFILLTLNLLFFIIYSITIINPNLSHIIMFVMLNYFYVFPINAIMKYTDNKLSFKEMSRISGLILNKQLVMGIILLVVGIGLGLFYDFLRYLFSNNTASFLMFIPFIIMIYLYASFLVKLFQTPILVIQEIVSRTGDNKLLIIAAINIMVLILSIFYLLFIKETLSTHLSNNLLYFIFVLGTMFSGYFGLFGTEIAIKKQDIKDIIEGIGKCQ